MTYQPEVLTALVVDSKKRDPSFDYFCKRAVLFSFHRNETLQNFCRSLPVLMLATRPLAPGAFIQIGWRLLNMTRSTWFSTVCKLLDKALDKPIAGIVSNWNLKLEVVLWTDQKVEGITRLWRLGRGKAEFCHGWSQSPRLRLRDSTCTAGSHVEKWRSFLEWYYLTPVLQGRFGCGRCFTDFHRINHESSQIKDCTAL